MVGNKILHYQLIEKIGAGGMGEIYKAQDSRLNRLVAVKILAPGLSTDPERKRRFFQEAQAASALNHPNIITLYDIVSEGDLQCIVMEYIGGKTLRELIPPGGLPPAQALQYASQIAGALAVAHAAGIIHRDLKPSNMMVTTSGLIKVLDFGLAKWVDIGLSGHTDEPGSAEAALTREGSIIGTVSYMSPEQAEGKRVDARSDIFSFGSVLYEMLTGKRAFEGRSGISTLSSILRDDVKPIYAAAPAVPPALEQIVQRCLSKEPAGRWQSMKEIEAALLALQRQLDPEGQFASPLPAVSLSVAVLPEPAFAEQGAAEWGESSPGMPVSLISAASVGSASPVAPAPMNGPSKVTPAPVSSPLHPRAPYPSPLVSNPPASKRPGPPQSSPPGTTARQRPLAPQAAAPRRASRSFSETSPKLLTLALVLIGAVLVAGAGIGGWYWKTHLASSASAAIATSLPAAPTPPVPALALPVQETAPPAENPQAAERPPETVPPAPVKADDAAKSAKVKRTPKPKPDKTAKIIPPAPAPVAPPPPAPEPVAAPPAPEPAPEPKPVIQSTPVTVSDALPFLINLTEDVPADATEGQALHFTVGEDLHVGDKTVIAKGAMVTGEVVGEAGKKRFLGLGGHKLTFRLTQAQAVDGRRLAVRALAKNDGPPARPFGNIKGAKSKGYVARQGAMYVAYIDGDQIVAVRN